MEAQQAVGEHIGGHTVTKYERFMSHVKKTSTCWLWIGSPFPFGYGRVRVKGKAQRAHRVAWEFFNGPIPKGVFVLHKCDVRNCVRWNSREHLYLGTRRQNTIDTWARTRRAVRHNLELPQLQFIRRHGKTLKMRSPLANLFGVSIETIAGVVSNRGTYTFND